MLMAPQLCFNVFSLTLSKLMAVFVPFLLEAPSQLGTWLCRARIVLVSSGCHVAETFGRRRLKPHLLVRLPELQDVSVFFFFFLTDKKILAPE